MRNWFPAAAAAVVLVAAPVVAASAKSSSGAAAILANPARPEADKARDADRKPAEVLSFAGVRPGMKISELAPGGGYFTRLLSMSVGPKGYVYAFGGRPSNAVIEWAKTNGNVAMVVGKGGDKLAPEPVDLVWTTQNYHDFKNAKVGDGDAAAVYNKAAHDALKPGGIYLVSDHEAGKGVGTSATSTLHRIESAAVIKEVEAAGFKLVGKSNLLAHPADNHTLKVVESGIRGKTDQFLLKFRKVGK
jgi:predicted methyltransferase